MSRTSWVLLWVNVAFALLNLFSVWGQSRWWGLISLFAVGYQLHVHQRIKGSRARREPVPPRNVRIVNRDGTTIPMELVYDGWVDGSHQWHAVTPWKVSPGWEIRADSIPAQTSIVMRAA